MPRTGAHGARNKRQEYLSDAATTAFVRRCLCPSQPLSHQETNNDDFLEGLLPPLTSRNDVDLQLYAIIAVILREFVQSWYNQLTSDDTFVEEIVQIIAHVTRGLEQRLRDVDLEMLLLDDIPALLGRHIQAYRLAYENTAQSALDNRPRHIYHSLWPLPHLQPVPDESDPETTLLQEGHESAYRQLLTQGILAILLPSEDLESECLTALVGQILAESVLGGIVAKKAAEPRMIWAGLEALVRYAQQMSGSTTTVKAFVLNKADKWVDMVLTWLMSILMIGRLTIAMLASVPSLPARWTRGSIGTKGNQRFAAPAEKISRPILATRIWSATSRLIELEKRMPWLNGLLNMAQWLALTGPGKLAAPDGVVDRFLSDTTQRRLLYPAVLPQLLRTIRATVMPNNSLNNPAGDASNTETDLQQLRRQCASAIYTLIPRPFGRFYFGGGNLMTLFWGSPEPSRDTGVLRLVQDLQAIEEIETGILDVFDDVYCNKHLVYSVLDLVIVRLMPELAVKSPSGLLRERLD